MKAIKDSKNYYHNQLIKTLLVSGVKPSDTSKEVIRKVKSKFGSKLDPKIEQFISSNWKREKRYFMRAVSQIQMNPIHPGQLCDPAANRAIILRTPDDKYTMADNSMYNSCKRCNGRLFPEFTFCPFCGIQLKQLPMTPETIQELPDMPPSGNINPHLFTTPPDIIEKPIAVDPNTVNPNSDTSYVQEVVPGVKGGPLGRCNSLLRKNKPAILTQSKVDKKPIKIRSNQATILVDSKNVRVTEADVKSEELTIKKFIPCLNK